MDFDDGALLALTGLPVEGDCLNELAGLTVRQVLYGAVLVLVVEQDPVPEAPAIKRTSRRQTSSNPMRRLSPSTIPITSKEMS